MDKRIISNILCTLVMAKKIPADCLDIIEFAVHWAVERLYVVEGYGPFNEF